MLKSKKKEDVPKLVQVSRAPRGKKKSVTVVSGLSTFGKLYIDCHMFQLFLCDTLNMWLLSLIYLKSLQVHNKFNNYHFFTFGRYRFESSS